MEEYILKIQNDELDDLPKFPLKQIHSDLVEFDVSLVRQFAFATSDDPYYEKSADLQKYFPEAVFFDDQGNVLGVLNKQNKEVIGNYISDCRDSKIKINDDRKLVIRSSALQNVQMILLYVRSNKTHTTDDHEYDRSVYRLLNEETN